MALILLRRLVRYLAMSVAVLASLLLVGYACLFLYTTRPYLEVTEVRAASTPQAFIMTWTVNCGEAYYQSDDKRKYWPQAPVGGKIPHDYPQIMWNGNSFVLIGYPYKKLLTNIFTGSKTEEHSERLDLVEWHIVTPYRVVNDKGESQSEEPVEWKNNDPTPSFDVRIDQSQKREC